MHQFSFLFEYETNTEFVAEQGHTFLGAENEAGGGEGVALDAGGRGDGTAGNLLNG